jgi:hypothetical protein
LLRDEGRDLAHAEELLDHAIQIASAFDPHIAARFEVAKAATQRLQSKSIYLSTLMRGRALIDCWREPALRQAVEKNLLYYLVLEGYFTEARRQQVLLPRPTIEVLLASRLCVDGCLDLAERHVISAKSLLRESLSRFSTLNRPKDTEVALLYVATAYHYEGDTEARDRHLIAAAQIARTHGFAEAPAIEQLIHEFADETLLAERILTVAIEAGGCLGPKTEAREY